MVNDTAALQREPSYLMVQLIWLWRGVSWPRSCLMPRTSLSFCPQKWVILTEFLFREGDSNPTLPWRGVPPEGPGRGAPWLARSWLVLPFIPTGGWQSLVSAVALSPEGPTALLRGSVWVLLKLTVVTLTCGEGREGVSPAPSSSQEPPGRLTLKP